MARMDPACFGFRGLDQLRAMTRCHNSLGSLDPSSLSQSAHTDPACFGLQRCGAAQGDDPAVMPGDVSNHAAAVQCSSAGVFGMVLPHC